jgi:hypothetical protein
VVNWTPKGYSADGFSSAIEMVVTPLLFVLGGLWLDRRFGTGWIIGATLGVLAVTGIVAKQWFVYNARMDTHQEALRLFRSDADAHAAELRASADAVVAAEQVDVETLLAAQRPIDALPIDLLERSA